MNVVIYILAVIGGLVVVNASVLLLIIFGQWLCSHKKKP